MSIFLNEWDEFRGWVIATMVIFVVIVLPLIFMSIKLEVSEQLVSGIVYNNQNNKIISGNTTFNIRASVDTYVNEDNTSSYCLPPNSPYIPLVKKAAVDKTIKVIVTTKKAFKIMAPWGCMDNVTVTLEK